MKQFMLIRDLKKIWNGKVLRRILYAPGTQELKHELQHPVMMVYTNPNQIFFKSLEGSLFFDCVRSVEIEQYSQKDYILTINCEEISVVTHTVMLSYE